MKTAPSVQIGWIVKARVMKDSGAIVVKEISKNFHSQAAADTFADIARKSKKYVDVWTTENKA